MGYVRATSQFSPHVSSFSACLCQVIFLFDFGTGAFGLLLADGLVYGCASVSNGIAEGWASRAAKEGSDFSIEAQAWELVWWCLLVGRPNSSGLFGSLTCQFLY